MYRHKTEHLPAHLPKAKEVEELIELTGQKVGKADEVVLTEKGQGLAEVISSRLSSSSNTPRDGGDDEAEESGGDSSSSSKHPSKSGDDEAKPKKTSSKTKKPKSLEEEEELLSQLASTFNYAYTEEGAKRCLERVKSAPEMALDIETYGRIKRDGLLYTKGRIRLISLHHGGESWFIDCDHVAAELVIPILE